MTPPHQHRNASRIITVTPAAPPHVASRTANGTAILTTNSTTDHGQATLAAIFPGNFTA